MKTTFEGVLALGVLSLVAPLILHRRPRAALALSSSLLACFGAAAAAVGFGALVRGDVFDLVLPPLVPGTTLTFRVDALSAFFLGVIGLITAVVSVFSVGYLRPYADKPGAARLAAATAAFALAMAVVVTASNVLLFLAAWELMSLASYLLVVHDHHAREARDAGFVYLVMTHVGTAFILAALLAMAGPGDPFAYDTLRAGSSRAWIFAALLIGFGTKAGLVPLHVWLPRAHPQAPAHASALMSAVMIKTAVYGFIRFGIEILGPGPMAWGLIVLGVGALSAVVGILHALMEHDLKRLLAFSTVENAGIIFVGLGASMALASTGRSEAAAVALAAALLHALNHAVYKGLLFLGAGAVHHATHTKNMEKLGGLIRRMPWTAAAMLVGCLSISALPPFNGFISEWLTLQALLSGFASASPALGVIFPLAAMMMAMTAGLAAACFVKAFGATFLARPRTSAAAEAAEAGRPMVAAVVALALMCLALGVMPGLMMGPLGAVTGPLTGASVADAVASAPIPTLRAGYGSISPALIGALLAVFALTLTLAVRPGRVRTGPTWGCGIDLDARMQYSPTSFSQPVRRFFGFLFGTREEVHVEKGPGGYFPRRVAYDASIRYAAEHYLYKPAYRTLMSVARRASAIQGGSLHLYLLYVLITAVVLLLWAA